MVPHRVCEDPPDISKSPFLESVSVGSDLVKGLSYQMNTFCFCKGKAEMKGCDVGTVRLQIRPLWPQFGQQDGFQLQAFLGEQG